MDIFRHCCVGVCLAIITAVISVSRGEPADSSSVLPPGVKAVWDVNKAFREVTATRERICINGLWQWQPAERGAETVPQDHWGYFKVPGAWPGITDYMQKDCQTVHAHPAWGNIRFGSLTAAWYRRTITIPASWANRRIALIAEYVNSLATVFLDGQKVGEIVFPAGELDITSAVRPGETHTVSILVEALPLKGVMLVHRDSNTARQVQGSVNRRGLCGDVWLVAQPQGVRIEAIRVETSIRKNLVRFVANLKNAEANKKYSLRAIVKEGTSVVKESVSPASLVDTTAESQLVLEASWRPEKLWDIHTPQNQYTVEVALLDERGQVLDAAWPERFGFREFWIDGRDFYLNGTRIFLCAVPLDNAQIGAAWASYQGARESLQRLKSFGINFVYTHNYDCQPGSHLSFSEILRAADDVGILVALSQPHFAQYDWQAENAEETNGYRQHARFYVHVAGNHPSVVMYSTSHNATGYNEDMNPDLIDGIHDPRDGWSLNNARRALRAEAILRQLDPTRIVYHHSSGNLGSMHTSNFYPNWVPIQEMCDWFEHWATVGVKPFFTCEYGAPFTWDWAMYRGWYKGQREFGSAVVPWDFCLAEWNAQFLGDRAYNISDQERRNLKWEAAQFRSGRLWYRWDYPHQLGSSDFDERYPIFAQYLTDNWRAFRTWGVSAISPWEYHIYWKMRPGLARNQRTELSTDWENLQRPGYSPDYLEVRYERMDIAYEPSDWVPTLAAQAMYRNNAPLLAYIAGGTNAFTAKDHNYLPGEVIEKQLIVINNSREPAEVKCIWQFGTVSDRQATRIKGKGHLPVLIQEEIRPASVLLQGGDTLSVETGQQARAMVHLNLPKDLSPGTYVLWAEFQFDNGDKQKDQFLVNILPLPDDQQLSAAVAQAAGRIGLFDPLGETRKLLDGLKVPYRVVSADSDLTGLEVLIIGKRAITADGPAPSLVRVREGLKVIVFEQTGEALEKRLGFRVAEYGLRNVFARVPNHPYLAGLNEDHLHDWRGEATLLPPRLKYEVSDKYAGAPVVRWCGLEVTRLWRCGNRGNVASVLIEKPQVGDFLPILDGGFSLQYSPLLEYREGRGVVLFCQMDVTGRTEGDPAAERLVRNILSYVLTTKYPVIPDRSAVYAGNTDGRRYLEQAGIACDDYRPGVLGPEKVLIVTPGAGEILSPNAQQIAAWLAGGGRVVALGLDGDEARRFLPIAVQTTPTEHIAAYFAPPSWTSQLAGISPADIHNRDPRILPLLTDGVDTALGGVLGESAQGCVIFCQMVPYQFVKRPRDVPSLRIIREDAAEGTQCAEVVMATVPYAQIGQKISAGSPGKLYTVAAMVKPVGSPATVRLEVERAGSPWDRAVRGKDQVLPPDRWTEIYETFRVEKAYPEGWQAYVHIGQPEVCVRLDHFRLYEGDYVPTNSGDRKPQANFFTNPGFESGSSSWYFNWNTEQQNLRKTFRRTAFLLSRLLANCGVRASTPLLERFGKPVQAALGPSLVKNGSFEIDEDQDSVPDGWLFSSENKLARCVLQEVALPGVSRCVQISVPESGERRGSAMLAQLNVPIHEGQWYRVSFWAKGENISSRQVTFAVQETTRWQAVLEYRRFTPEPEWKEFTFLMPGRQTAETKTRLQIWFDGTGTLWLANFAITPCEPPSAGRWLEGLYLEVPQEWDDPYRFFRW